MLRDVVQYALLGAVLFLFVCGAVFADDGTLLPPNMVQWANSAFQFLASPLGPPPRGSEAEMIPQGLVLSSLIFSVLGFIVHLIKP